MSDTLYPLAIYPFPLSEGRLALVRQAKANLNLDYRVVPRPAVPESPTRVLSLDGPPPFVCDVAIARSPDSLESIQRALEWVLTAPEGDKRGFMVEDYVAHYFPGAVEVFEQPGWSWDG